jgi:acylphosphatase
MKKAVLAIAKGRVQGVGFRYFLVKKAELLGVSGWTRNLADGSVETMAVGEAEALERFMHELREGPVGSRVQSVDFQWVEGSFEFLEFEILG